MKIPLLFEMDDSGKLTNRVREYCKWVFTDTGVKATRQFDGLPCAIIGGELYKRHDFEAIKTAKTAVVGDLVKKRSGKLFRNGDYVEKIAKIHRNDPKKRHKIPQSKQKAAEFSNGDTQSLKRLKFAKPRWNIPDNAIPCCDPDIENEYWSHWVPCDRDNPADKYYWEVFDKGCIGPDHHRYPLGDGNYELCGPKIKGNPEGFYSHVLIKHGKQELHVLGETLITRLQARGEKYSYGTLYDFLSAHNIKGIVFYHPDGRMVKIRTNDFGLKR